MSWLKVASFDVLGNPKGQPRPRAFARGGRAHCYDPGTAEGWKSLVAQAAKPFIPEAPLEGPVRVDIDFLFTRPARLMKKSSPAERIFHIAKPDKDNCEKAILDSLTIIGIWSDDSQVCSGTTQKFYTSKTERAGASISIYQWEEDVA